jgi:formamidopyrimidine-DNA glycosylase
MPELPSVEIYKKYFDKTSLNQTIRSFEVKNPEILINTTPLKLQKALVGRQFVSSKRYGKYLFSRIDSGYFLILHFGMTGYLKYFQKNSSPHIRVLISFQNGCHLAFDDMRKFGKVGLTRDQDNFIKEKKLGPDALAIDFKTFKEIFKKREGTIKPLIMNQKVIAGIGNLYADETLYQSGIHPLTRVDKLKSQDIQVLYEKMKFVLEIAIEHLDRPREMPEDFLLPHRYNGGICPDGGEIKTIKVGGLTTYFCPGTQKQIK